MARRTIATAIGAVVLAAFALLPSVAGAQYEITTTTAPTTSTSVAGNSTTSEAPTTTEAPATTEPTETTDVSQLPEEVTPPPEEEVKGDVVSRPLPRTGNDISGTAIFGGALTILGVVLALGARKRRNSFDGA
jgi:LPXTG-motif cell wall-anchored protein